MQGKTCDLCGDVGFEEHIVTCNQCTAREHIYCTRYNSLIIPHTWYCYECCLVSAKLGSKDTFPDASESNPINGINLESKECKNSESLLGGEEPTHAPIPVRNDTFSEEKAWEIPENKEIGNEESLLGEGEQPHALNHARKNESSTERAKEILQNKETENEQSFLDEGEQTIASDNARKNASEARAQEGTANALSTFSVTLKPAPNHSGGDGSKARARQAMGRALPTSLLTAKSPCPFQRSGDKFHGDAKLKSSGVQERHLSYNLLHYEKYPSNRPKLEATWNGCFKIHHMIAPDKIFSGFRAHLPCKFDRKVYDFSKQMPKILQFKLIRRTDIWEEIFQHDCAFGYNISLYFFPGNFNRAKHIYVHLLRFIEMQDMVMKCCLEGVELFVFTSKQLCYAEELKWAPFFWGVFRAVKENIVTAPPIDELFKAHAQTSAGKDGHVAATPSADELIEVHVQTCAGKHNHTAAIPSSGLFNVHVQTSNAEKKVRLHSSEAKKMRTIDLNALPVFSGIDAAHEVIFQNSLSNLVEIPIYQVTAADNVDKRDDKGRVVSGS
ncbi:hypothetical protein CFOL_v3_29879 [Cephalotus follicularis]|uniref:AIPP2-like SPOC-like domain-containing protein n=1 Tax=Cephalotus follicularis TaxID=3775 RepID=A0A1Q3D1U4_CEPFO|nr:hypothetical protein CFOL_v3_29879 [Cephalotus follicularis]